MVYLYMSAVFMQVGGACGGGVQPISELLSVSCIATVVKHHPGCITDALFQLFDVHVLRQCLCRQVLHLQ